MKQILKLNLNCTGLGFKARRDSSSRVWEKKSEERREKGKQESMKVLEQTWKIQIFPSKEQESMKEAEEQTWESLVT